MPFIVFSLLVVFIVWITLIKFDIHVKVSNLILDNKKFTKNEDVEKEKIDNV